MTELGAICARVLTVSKGCPTAAVESGKVVAGEGSITEHLCGTASTAGDELVDRAHVHFEEICRSRG